MPTETPEQWNQRYVDGDTPWDNEVPDSQLRRVLAKYGIAPCRVLELGCGTGTNAVYLAQQGFEVTAFDVSPLAVAKAGSRAAAAGASVRLLESDVFDLPPLGEPFPFVFDRGVYHVVRRQNARRFRDVVAGLTAPGGWYFTLAGNANEENPPEGGPPRVSAEEICRELSGPFELVQLREFRFDPIVIEGVVDEPLAWSALWRRSEPHRRADD